MKKDFVKQMQLKLEAEKRSLTERLAAISTKTRHNGNGDLEPQWEDLGEKEDENAAEVATYQDTLSLEKNLAQSLEEVERALTSMKAGTYGTCAKCGRAIEPARLEIFPAAQLCMDHKAEAG